MQTPMISGRFLQQTDTPDAPLVVVDVPLLYETDHAADFDRVPTIG